MKDKNKSVELVSIGQNDIIGLINKAKIEIEEVKKGRTENKETIDEISSLKGKLQDIEKALRPVKMEMEDRIKNLNLILNELSKIKSDIILSKKEQMLNVIEKNLLDGIVLESEEGNKKLIRFDKTPIGFIEVLEEDIPDIKIRVTVYNNNDEYIIEDPLKIYNIISFINTKFNYKQQ